MKANPLDPSVGMAIEPFTEGETGTITVFMDLQKETNLVSFTKELLKTDPDPNAFNFVDSLIEVMNARSKITTPTDPNTKTGGEDGVLSFITDHLTSFSLWVSTLTPETPLSSFPTSVLEVFTELYDNMASLLARVTGLEERITEQEEVNKKLQAQIDELKIMKSGTLIILEPVVSETIPPSEINTNTDTAFVDPVLSPVTE
jgi:hypothetical protein